MKIHTTNYYNTFIESAEDCPAKAAEVPPVKGEKKSIANLQFEMLYGNPYKYTSDEVIFNVHATRNSISRDEQEAERQKFFSKGQACFRASTLLKRYGWGLHSNEEGRIALYPVESAEYKKFTKQRGKTRMVLIEYW